MLYVNYTTIYVVLEKAMAPHSSTLAWKILWTQEPGGPQSMGSLRVRHDWVTSVHFSLSCIWEGNGNPLQYSCLENPRDGGAWWAAVYRVAQSRTRLKRLSCSSSCSSSSSSSSICCISIISQKIYYFLKDTTRVWTGSRVIAREG